MAAIVLWATLAPMGSILGNLPPFFVTGTGLLIGSVLALFVSRGQISKMKVPPRTLLVGVFGLFGFHAALFTALQMAPPVQANLVNYLWPLLIVVLAPMFFPGTSLRVRHVIAAMVGFLGAALAIISGGEITGGGKRQYTGVHIDVGRCDDTADRGGTIDVKSRAGDCRAVVHDDLIEIRRDCGECARAGERAAGLGVSADADYGSTADADQTAIGEAGKGIAYGEVQ